MPGIIRYPPRPCLLRGRLSRCPVPRIPNGLYRALPPHPAGAPAAQMPMGEYLVGLLH
jgi:hypothetical protein